jgi:hypothetical protein
MNYPAEEQEADKFFDGIPVKTKKIEFKQSSKNEAMKVLVDAAAAYANK